MPASRDQKNVILFCILQPLSSDFQPTLRCRRSHFLESNMNLQPHFKSHFHTGKTRFEISCHLRLTVSQSPYFAILTSKPGSSGTVIQNLAKLGRRSTKKWSICSCLTRSLAPLPLSHFPKCSFRSHAPLRSLVLSSTQSFASELLGE